MRKILILYLAIFIVFQAGFAVAEVIKTGNHYGEAGYLAYSIEYLEPKGITIVNDYGITFKPFDFDWSFLPEILPSKYFGDWPLYFTGDTLHFKVHLKNIGKRTFRNLKIIAIQEFLNPDGGKGENIGDNNSVDWFLAHLGPGEEIILEGIFEIPLVGESGLDQTHLLISHWKDGNNVSGDNRGRIITDDPQAGIWCPLTN